MILVTGAGAPDAAVVARGSARRRWGCLLRRRRMAGALIDRRDRPTPRPSSAPLGHRRRRRPEARSLNRVRNLGRGKCAISPGVHRGPSYNTAGRSDSREKGSPALRGSGEAQWPSRQGTASVRLSREAPPASLSSTTDLQGRLCCRGGTRQESCTLRNGIPHHRVRHSPRHRDPATGESGGGDGDRRRGGPRDGDRHRAGDRGRRGPVRGQVRTADGDMEVEVRASNGAVAEIEPAD